MALPYFFIKDDRPLQGLIELDEDTSRHVVQVLRMAADEQLQLTDGKGHLAIASITSAHKKHCTVTIRKKQWIERPGRHTVIALSLLKNANRFEWFLEKATEMGIREIVPLICKRTEKEHFRLERMQGILISAMLQSQQAWLPVMGTPLLFDDWVQNTPANGQRFIAHCEEDKEKELLRTQIAYTLPGLVAVGPEGDFTPAEIALAKSKGFAPVSLGDTRLRTETAALVAAAWISS